MALLGIFAGLVGPQFVSLYNRPRLGIGRSSGDFERVAVRREGAGLPRGGYICWLRLPVVNHGRTTAQHVRVLLRSLERSPNSDGHRPPSREMKWADVSETEISLPIPPGVTRLVDVLHVVRTNTQVGAQALRCGVVAGVVPYGPWDRKKSGASPLWQDAEPGDVFVARLTLMAENAKARDYCVTVDLGELTEADRVRECLLKAAVHKERRHHVKPL